MPLHLLGKKSWNVYNTENIARVRQDEADARRKDEELERQLRQQNASARLSLLRNEDEALNNEAIPGVRSESQHTSTERNDTRKRRRLAGESETDRDLRVAHKEISEKSSRSDTSLFDHKGHINLIPSSYQAERNVRDKQNNEHCEGMRLKDAHGYKNDGQSPWYASTSRDSLLQSVSHDVWGQPDRRRGDRDQRRLVADDPLLAMKRGVKELRDIQKQREDWIAERERDWTEVDHLANRSKRRRDSSRDDDDDVDSIENLDLNASHASKTSDSHGSRTQLGGRHASKHDFDHKRRRRHKSAYERGHEPSHKHRHSHYREG